MKTKFETLEKAFKDAKLRNESILIYIYGVLLSYTNSKMTNEEFEKETLLLMKERAKIATNYLKKNNSKLADQEIYCISLLSFTILDGRNKPNIDGKQVTINNE